MSLADYAANNRPKTGTPCWLCGIPERAEVEQAVLSGKATKADARRWLREARGYQEATENRINGHFANHVNK